MRYTTYTFFWQVGSLFLSMYKPGIGTTRIPEGHSFDGSSISIKPDTIEYELNDYTSPVKVKVILTRTNFAFSSLSSSHDFL